MSALAPPAQSRLLFLLKPTFPFQMAYAGAAIVIVSIAGCKLTSIQVSDVGSLAVFFALILVALLPLFLYLSKIKWFYLRDAILVVLSALFFSFMLGFPVSAAARLGMGIPLQDSRFIQWDRSLGVYVPNIAAWASHSRLGILVGESYALLFPFMRVAVLLPTLAGKVKDAQHFLIANLIAFTVGLPVFALLPAVGPWYGYHLAAIRPDQVACQEMVSLLRCPGPFLYRFPVGVICFPSFHVVWAILCAQALWGFRLLRIPVSILSAIIVASTLATGNHYFCDVLAGIVVAAVAIVSTERFAGWLAKTDRDSAGVSRLPSLE